MNMPNSLHVVRYLNELQVLKLSVELFGLSVSSI